MQLSLGRSLTGTVQWSRGEGLSFEVLAPLAEPGLRVQFMLHGLVMVVTGRAELQDGSAFKYLLHEARWFTFDRRSASRLPLSHGVATLEWVSPAHPGGLASSEVSDLTPLGLQLVLGGDVILPEHERFPASLRIGEQAIKCVAELRQLVGAVDQVRAGVSLRTAPHDDALASAYLAHRFPRLRPRHEISPALLRDMLQRSGYLSLRDNGQVSDEWCSLQLPHDTSWDFVYQASDGAVLGLASATRVYEHTWLFHQLATVGGHREAVACRKMLYGLACAIPNIYSGEQAFGLAYFDLKKRWHRLFFEEFCHWVDDPREAVVVKLDRFERDLTLSVEAPLSARAPEGALRPVAGYSVARADERELVIATAFARKQLPRLTADALSLAPWSLSDAQLCGARHADQLRRSREVLVLRGPSGVEGVALCELGSAQVSLFGILDMAHVFVSTGDNATPLAAQLLLLAKVREFYATHQVQSPIVVSPHATLRATEEPGTQLVETMGAVAMASSAMRQWENFCQFHFGHQSRAAD